MKKVGLAVVTYKDNFGSALQTYATQETLNRLGFETGIFDITGVKKSMDNKKKLFYLTRMLNPDEFKYVTSKFFSRKKKESGTGEYAHNMAIRHQVYQNFYAKELKFLPHVEGWKALGEQASECDAILVGSDQLWRPSNIAGRYFTLEFVPSKIKKIAYSTSFGVADLPKGMYKHAKKFLNRIEYLSVREETGAKLVKKLTGKDIPVVCDPTMLLTADEWMKIQKDDPIISGDYILTYFMGDNPQHREFAKKLKESTGYKIVGLLHGSVYLPEDEKYVDEAPYDIGPGEFINLIRNAKYMCTDSFHGTVFSILNKTKFFSFRRYEDSSETSSNDRIYTLLKWTGLDERMLYGNEDVKEQVSKSIDYESVLKKVNVNRQRSMMFLTRALNLEG